MCDDVSMAIVLLALVVALACILVAAWAMHRTR